MDQRLQLLKRSAQTEGTAEAWQRYAAALERAIGGDAELSRDDIKAVAIAAVQELNRIDGAMPCLPQHRRQGDLQDGGLGSRCDSGSHDVPVWGLGQHSNHGQEAFYGNAIIDGERIILCPYLND